MVDCPICLQSVKSRDINAHIDSGCEEFIVDTTSPPLSQVNGDSSQKASISQKGNVSVSSFFQTPAIKRTAAIVTPKSSGKTEPLRSPSTNDTDSVTKPPASRKRSFDDTQDNAIKKEAEGDTKREEVIDEQNGAEQAELSTHPAKKPKSNAFQKVAPLAERMRPYSLDDVYGQELVGPKGVLRSLIDQARVPSMILWGGAGTGKTTIARVMSQMVGSRFVEINSTSSGVGECKKIFAEARNELSLTGRRTFVFCDEIHRFSKSQQDVFLGPVESGQITLIGATTENPSFKVQNALLSRCRTFTLQKLTDEDVGKILERALAAEGIDLDESASESVSLLDSEFIKYLSAFSDGDARTALNLLELAISLSLRKGMTKAEIKSALTKTLVYDRAGDQHYDTISAFHKSVRGSNPDASLYYLARMLQSGEDPLFIARRIVVIASEDVGLADNTLLSLATSTYTACEKIGMPECRIALAHATVALCIAPKSTRVYRGLNNAFAALREPGVASLPIPIHLRNAPTKLMKEMGYGAEYKYNPNYKEGRVVQDYFPETMKGRKFLEERDLGTEIDPGAWS